MTGFGSAAYGVALAGAALLVASPAAAELKRGPELDALVKAAEAEGTLNVVWGGSSLGEAKGAAAIQAALNREFGAHFAINFTPGPAMPQMGMRIIQEVKAGQPSSSDVYLGVEVNIATMLTEHALQEVPWSRYFPDITPEMQTKNHEAVLAYTLFEGFSYNSQLIPENEVPHKTDELFRPEWKGKLASTSYAAGFDQLALAYGEDKVLPLVRKTAEWAGGLIRCGEYDRIASGEFLGLFLDCGQIAPDYMVENGGPVKLALIDDALVTELTYLGVPKTSAHPNLAKLFAGFIATPEGQAVIAKFGATSTLVPGTAAYEQAKAIDARGAKLLFQPPDEIAPRMAEDERYKEEEERVLRGK